MSKLTLDVQHHPIENAPDDYRGWYISIAEMPGVGESGKTKEDALNELMISLKVKIMYDNKDILGI